MSGKALGEQILECVTQSDWLWHAVNEDPLLDEAGPHLMADYVDEVLEPLKQRLWELLESLHYVKED